MATRKIVRIKSKADENAYLYRFVGGDIFLRLVKLDDGYELRNPIGNDVQLIKCNNLIEADSKAKDILEAFFVDDKVVIIEL